MERVSHKKQYVGVYKKSGGWYLGWIEEIPGVNTQGRTMKEVRENLREALGLILETNRAMSKADSAKGKLIRESVSVFTS